MSCQLAEANPQVAQEQHPHCSDIFRRAVGLKGKIATTYRVRNDEGVLWGWLTLD